MFVKNILTLRMFNGTIFKPKSHFSDNLSPASIDTYLPILPLKAPSRKTIKLTVIGRKVVKKKPLSQSTLLIKRLDHTTTCPAQTGNQKCPDVPRTPGWRNII